MPFASKGRTPNAKDPPPFWKEDRPADWQRHKRYVRAWAYENDDADPAKLSVKLWRQGFAEHGTARMIIDQLDESVVASAGGVEAILRALDQVYSGYQQVVNEDTFSRLMYGPSRPPNEDFVSYTTKFVAEATRYEAMEKAPLPERTKIRLILRRASLSVIQKQMIQTWMGDEPESFSKLITMLHRLSDPRCSTSGPSSSASAAASSKVFQVEERVEEPWYPDWDPDPSPEPVYAVEEEEEDDTEDDPELLAYYLNADNDAGLASSDDDQAWIYAEDLCGDLDGDMAEGSWMTFLEAKRALHQRRLSRGFGGKTAGGKGKNKGLSHGKTRPTKGKSKGFGKRTGMGPRVRQAREERDNRRRDHGMVKLSRAEIFARAKCYNCGERGHLARECKKGEKGGLSHGKGKKGKGKTAAKVFFTSLPEDGEAASYVVERVYGIGADEVERAPWPTEPMPTAPPRARALLRLRHPFRPHLSPPSLAGSLTNLLPSAQRSFLLAPPWCRCRSAPARAPARTTTVMAMGSLSRRRPPHPRPRLHGERPQRPHPRSERRPPHARWAAPAPWRPPHSPPQTPPNMPKSKTRPRKSRPTTATK